MHVTFVQFYALRLWPPCAAATQACKLFWRALRLPAAEM